ncbi:MAG TPA: hypothetical protein VN132_03550 [Bdellovibrio sp.]|nr:hypothetical protein [Bdellovibrio sp.]
MAFSWEAREGVHKQLTWHDLERAIKQQKSGLTASNIAICLKRLLECFEESEFITYIVVPSPSSLALNFQIPIKEIYRALKLLNIQGYQTEGSGHYAPIIVWDPLRRERTQGYMTARGSIDLDVSEAET